MGVEKRESWLTKMSRACRTREPCTMQLYAQAVVGDERKR
jgi:hypothetical protein